MEHCALVGFKAREHQEGEEKGGIYTDQQVKHSQSHMDYSGSELKLWFTQTAGRAESAGEEMSEQVLQAAEARQAHICHMDGNSGQREAAAEEQDSKIWNHFTDK